MIFAGFSLEGGSQRELDTEIKYLIASARTDDVQLVCLRVAPEATAYAIKILRALKKVGSIQFYVLGPELDGGGREAEYILNKYGEYIGSDDGGAENIYVKI